MGSNDISKDELISFADGLIVEAKPSSVELASTEGGENYYIVRFHNSFFFFVKGDSIYNLWKKRELMRINFFLKIADVEIQSVTRMSIKIKSVSV